MTFPRPIPRAALLAGLVAATLHFAGAALAQRVPGSEDLRALRFYIQQNDTAAIQAEIRRLQGEFPGWTPPADLSALREVEPTREIADIYARLERGDVAGARRVLDATRGRFPAWEVPPDLAHQIELAEAQLAFDRAYNARDAAEAVRVGARVPALFRCDRINNAWKLAELQAAAGNAATARAAYGQIVRTCTRIPDLVATIEKAEPVTSNAQLTDLTAIASQRFPADAATFDKLLRRLLAGRGARPVAAPVKPAPKPGKTVPAAPRPSPAPVAAAAPPPPPPAGSTLALSSLPRSGDSRLAATRAAKEAGSFRECLAGSAAPRSLDLAYERAWCAYNLERPLEALAYFAAAAQGNLGGTVPRDARFGMALSFLKRAMTDDAAQIAGNTDLTPEQRFEVESIILDQRGVTAFEMKDFRAAIDYFDALEQLQGNLRRDLAIMRGYAYLALGDRSRAHAQFQLLHDALATPETRKALAASD